jgi:hypothetical protein
MAAISEAGSSRRAEADLRRYAEQQRQAAENKQRDRLLKQKLDDQTTAGKQRAADNQTFEKAFVRGIQTGDVAAGGHQRKQQTLL